MLKLRTEDIMGLYMGSAPIIRAYIGSELVFENVKIYTVTISIDPSGAGSVTGAGTYKEGELVTVKATAAEGYQFACWTVNNMEVSTGESYTFAATVDVEIKAWFKKSRLPSGYIEVEYILSDSDCKIDTGVQFDLTKGSLEMVFSAMPYKSGLEFILDNSNAQTPRSILYRSSSTKMIRIWGYATSGANTTLDLGYGIVVLSIKNGSVKIGSTTIATMTASAITDGNVCLFHAAHSNSSFKCSSIQAKMYSCTIHSSDRLVRDFVPCKKLSGEVGLYDLVSKVFYTNAGTGTFTAGPVV